LSAHNVPEASFSTGSTVFGIAVAGSQDTLGHRGTAPGPHYARREEQITGMLEEPERRSAIGELEPRWPALVALLASSLLYYLALMGGIAFPVSWLPLVLVFILSIPTIFTHRQGHPQANYILLVTATMLITLFALFWLYLLVRGLLQHSFVESPPRLLQSAVALWVTNVLVFALWYWLLDAGGPHKRDQREGHPDGAFLFPQMTLDEATGNGPTWSPRFVDYLFLAFNTSTALSPTDTAVLSRWAKVAMMVQAGISLAIIGLLAAYAVNIL
jgi:hypothetical protein